MVELQNIPNELRVAAGVPPPQSTDLRKNQMVDPKNVKSISDVEHLKEEERKMKSRADPEFGRFTYGAWYLPKKYWTKRDVELPLENPKDVNKRKTSDIAVKKVNIDEQLATLDGSRSFLEFLQKKPRKPEVCQFLLFHLLFFLSWYDVKTYFSRIRVYSTCVCYEFLRNL